MKRSRFGAWPAARFGAWPVALCAVLVLASTCTGGDEEDGGDGELQVDFGVDLENQVLTIGALNDNSGPASVIGNPFSLGKQILVEQVNAGGTDLLPAGWSIELIERDHGFNPQQAVQLYNEIEGEVLFLATSFGTPTTLPLQPLLERDNVMAFPASLSSAMAEFEYTPPIGAPYTVEAMRAMEFAVEQEGSESGVQPGIVYQEDDYGADGLSGWRDAAEFYGTDIVSEQPVAPTGADFTAVVTALQDEGANYVLLATLPSQTTGILGTARQLGYEPTWIGLTPSWVDVLGNQNLLPLEARENYYWVSSLVLWRDQRPGIDEFHEAYANFGAGEHLPDLYILASYQQGLVELEAFRRALENGDVTREGFKQALRSIEDYDADGFFPAPFDFSEFPYRTGSEVRVLQPGDDILEMEVVSDFRTPEAALAG